MSTYSKVDLGTLGWVKTEIDETLKQARLALESFIENPADKTNLRFCLTHLHQVVGTLVMVELDGAALLARETEALAEAILGDKIEASPAHIETLTRGILLLPEYLARLQYGSPDVPLRHLALINELRAAHGVPLISEGELFAPDLGVRPPPSAQPAERLSEENYRELARQLRATFQPRLLGWLRDATQKQALGQIAGVLEQLQVQAGLPAMEQMFWAARGLLEALAEDGLEATAERKKLLSRLDQQIKKLIDGAERSQIRSSAEALTRAILWELAHARSSGPLATQLKRAFELDAILGVAAETATEERPAPETLQSVSALMAKEIESAQDILAAYFDPEQKDGVSLEPLFGTLHRISGALEMIGLTPLRGVADELTQVARALADKRLTNPLAASMPAAEALLLIEQCVRNVNRPSAEWEKQAEASVRRLRALQAPGAADQEAAAGIEVSEASLSESEFKQLLTAVANEANVNLAKIEETVEDYAKNPSRRVLLDEVPGLLSQIEGAAQILGQGRVAELAGIARGHIQGLLAGRLDADQPLLEALAVCIGTIGAYLDGLRAGRRNLDALIDAALREIGAAVPDRGPVAAATGADDLANRLRASVEAWLANRGDAQALAQAQQSLEAICNATDRTGQARLYRLSSELSSLLRLIGGQPDSLTPAAEATLRQSLNTIEELVRQDAAILAQHFATPAPPPAAPPKPAPVKSAALPQGFDEEILPIFIEDARDVLQNVRREFALWRENPDNPQALAELRRGYHTLKGSGRMVKASAISELAWAIEKILNRLREGGDKPSAAVFDLVTRTQDVLPQMIAHLEGGPPPTVDVEALRLEAEAMSELQAAAPAPAPRAPEPARPAADSGLPKLDKTLLGIFTNEARGHLATIREELASCHASGICFVSDMLFRANHTLLGNARSLGIAIQAEACGEVEKLLNELRAKAEPLHPGHLDMLARLESAVSDLVTALNNGDAGADLAQRLREIAHEAREESSRHAAPEIASPGAAAPGYPFEGADIIEQIEIEAAPAPEPPAVAPGIGAPGEPPAPGPAFTTPAATGAAVATEEVDPDLLDVFHEEAVDILHRVEETLTRWRARPDDMAVVPELKRGLHTLKGGARMAGAMTMGDLSHNTESLLNNVEDRLLAPSSELFDLLDEIHDTLADMLNRMQHRQSVPDVHELNGRVTALVAGQSQPARVPAPAPSAAPPTSVDVVRDTDRGAEEAWEHRPGAEEKSAWPEGMERRGQVRVSTGLLSELANFAGEVSISRSRMEQQIYSFRDNLAELARNVARFREQIRELEIQSESQILYRVDQNGEAAAPNEEFDPLEFDRFTRLQQLSRQLAESLHDLSAIQNNLGNFIGEAETALQQQARINTELQEGLMRTRMVSFMTVAARLRHIVRQTARELGKRVELNLVGAEVELDRNVLERMIGPFEHMIRNAIDHGIEPESLRARAGKPAVGRITVATAQEGSEIVIRFSDDGAGLDIEAIRAKAAERGMMSPEANLTEDELVQFILMSGFSTAREVTHLSGRGVGMDVVHNEVKQLGGTMSVNTRRGEGTSFVIRLPLTLSITQALMVQVSDQVYAVPLASVANIIEYPVEKLNSMTVGSNALLNFRDQVYSCMSLGVRLGIPSQVVKGRKIPVLLVRAGQREIAVQVDALRGTREVVIKALGPQLSEIKGLSGATILGDGRVVLILDVAGLWYRDEAIRVEHRPEARAAVEARTRPVVMVVDDSLTVRKVTSKHLQKHGLEVMVAKDGLDAWEQLRERIPEVMLVDIEMPRMDGYELTTRVRADARLKNVPIIMITSRAGAKHRQKAFELGVDMYMSKPYQEEELYRNIETLLANGRAT